MIKEIAVAAALVLAMGSAAKAQINPIETRQTGMDLVAATANGAKQIIAANGDIKSLEGAGKGIKRWGAVIPTLFPAGSDKGAVNKAGPAIWTDNAGFQKAAMALSTAGASLEAAAKAGDATAVGAAFKAVGEACGTCHKDYRLK